ncbi:MAG: contractile injection system protein, VgrG/Pvc8 family, partial [Syntrophomonadaceae bacterium]|nr:contractile injection system protein, VgrG/Pvc8 family [Syntrophomonadaceae bacterium]
MGLNALDFKVLVGGTDLKQAGVIISSLSLDCSVEKADSFHMVVEYGFNMYTAFSDLHADLVLGKEVQVDLGYVDDLTTAFQGYITSIKIEVAEEPQEARVVISGLDKSLVLMKTVKSRSFLKKKYSDIASTIAGETGLSAVVDATDQTYDYIEQPGISDYQLLSSLAEKSGREFFVSAGKLYFRKLPEGGSSVKT